MRPWTRDSYPYLPGQIQPNDEQRQIPVTEACVECLSPSLHLNILPFAQAPSFARCHSIVRDQLPVARELAGTCAGLDFLADNIDLQSRHCPDVHSAIVERLYAPRELGCEQGRDGGWGEVQYDASRDQGRDRVG